MRPGRLDSSTTRSPSRTASRTLCVTKSTVRLVLPPDALELVVQDVAGHRVERAERLVHQQDVARPARAHAASATRCRMPPESSWGRLVANSREVHELEQFVAARPALRCGRHRRAAAPARCCLGAVSHGNSAASWNMSAVRPADVDGARRSGWSRPGDEVEQRALAAARRAEEADELAGLDVERDPVERVHGVAGVAEDLRDVAHLDGRGTAGLAPGRETRPAGRPPEGAVAPASRRRRDRRLLALLQHLVRWLEIVEILDAGLRASTALGRPSDAASFADFCKDDGIGSAVNVMLSNDTVTSSGAIGLPVSASDPVDDVLLGLGACLSSLMKSSAFT